MAEFISDPLHEIVVIQWRQASRNVLVIPELSRALLLLYPRQSWSMALMFLVQVPVLGLSHACSERLRLRSNFVDVCQTEFSLATEISVFLILISLIFVIAF